MHRVRSRIRDFDFSVHSTSWLLNCNVLVQQWDGFKWDLMGHFAPTPSHVTHPIIHDPWPMITSWPVASTCWPMRYSSFVCTGKRWRRRSYCCRCSEQTTSSPSLDRSPWTQSLMGSGHSHRLLSPASRDSSSHSSTASPTPMCVKSRTPLLLVTCEYTIVYLKSIIRNYSIAGKGGHWPASEDISLPYLTLPLWYNKSTNAQQVVQENEVMEFGLNLWKLLQ